MTVTTLPRRLREADPVEESSARWVPSRAGILNVWRYYDEVFEFHEGRLLLRGPNGTGKSKALELLLPFLFDANLRANRLSTFGTGERSMHWNLMGEGASGTTRVGYVWLEFRLSGDPDAWFCCGARLQASSHTSTVHADYFTTTSRIGLAGGLSLVTEAGLPLTRSVLEQSIGDSGALHPSATEYRAAVRATLFPGLSEQRYDALITALLQLRTPKLSQRLDPSLLSTLLSRALPPLDQQEIAELAEGFERLDRQRERLAALDQEVQAASTLAARQKTYAQRVLRAAAAQLISLTSELDKLTRTARRSAEEYELVNGQRSTVEGRIETLISELERTDGHIAGLVDSDLYGRGRELDKLRQQVAQADRRATELVDDAARKLSQAASDAATLDHARRTADSRIAVQRDRQDDALRAATRADLATVHTEIDAAVQSDPRRATQLLRAAVRSRHDQVAEVRRVLRTHADAVSRRELAETELANAQEELSTAQGHRAEAARRHAAELDGLVDRLQAWAAACHQLVFPDLDALTAAVESEAAVLRQVEAVAVPLLEQIAGAEATISLQRADLVRQRDSAAAELERLLTERDLPPAAPPTRTVDRSTLTGAPLWRLVRFADTVPEADQAGLEAALEAAGLLDAWVGHTGAVHGHDLFADPSGLAPAAGPSLADVLVPEPDSPVEAAAVTRLLASIAYGDRLPGHHPAAVGADGRWRLANLTGSWHKAQPTHVGAVARERARRRRAQELTDSIATFEAAIAETRARLGSLQARRNTIADERAARPGHGALEAAAQELTRAEADVSAADRAVRSRVETLTTREAAVVTALRALTALAAENGLPHDQAALDELDQAIDRFATATQSWLDAHHEVRLANQTVEALWEQANRAEAAAAQRQAEAQQAQAHHRTLSATLSTVEDTVGVDYNDLMAQLEAGRRARSELDAELNSARRGLTRLAGRLGELNVTRTTDAQARDAAVDARDRAAHRFRRLSSGNFPADSGMADRDRFHALLGGSDGVRAALEAARTVAAAWPTVPHAPNNLGDASHRLSEAVHDCRTALSDRADLDLESDEDVQVFTALVNGVRVGAAELLAVLRSEAERSRQEITERERDLFDKTLTGNTRRHLAARIRQANELVAAMNTRLERVRTASRVAVQLVWQVGSDLQPGTRAARDLLLKDPLRLTDADRRALHQFFRDRIEQAKAADTATSWEQQLTQVFDYTAWHQFVVKVDRGTGADWQLLTKKLHGALSGGEKAIVLHLPLFAAVAAHYQAVPSAPRLILLDEVFVGVDSNNRGQVFELLAALDLDLVLTSDHEWCTYRELSGIAVHQLITGTDNDDAVTTARFTWNGTDLIPDSSASP